MTFHLHSDSSKQNKIITHLKWLKEVGLIHSFELDLSTSSTNQSSKEIEDFFDNMVRESEEEYERGEVFSPEQVKKMIEENLNSFKAN